MCSTLRSVVLIVVCFNGILKQAEGDDSCVRNNEDKAHAVKLKNDLFCYYDKKFRPTMFQETTTDVQIQLAVKYFQYMEESGSLAVDNWFILAWTDEHLKWTPKEYGDIASLPVKSSEIWMPDIALFNSDNMMGAQNLMPETNCVLMFNGDVGCVVPNRHDASCKPNYLKFPYDTQICSLMYGSWLRTAQEINITLAEDPADIEDMDENNSWQLQHVTGRIEEKKYGAVTGRRSFQTVTYTFRIKRHSGVLSAVMVVCGIVLVSMSMLAMCMDPSCPERVYLLMISVYCHLIQLSDLSWTIPATGEQSPLIIQFYRDSLLVTISAFVMTLLVRFVLSVSMVSPVWLSGLVAAVVRHKAGSVILMPVADTKVSGIIGGENNVQDNLPNETSNEWIILGKFLDRLFLFAVTMTYIGMFCTLIPHAS